MFDVPVTPVIFFRLPEPLTSPSRPIVSARTDTHATAPSLLPFFAVTAPPYPIRSVTSLSSARLLHLASMFRLLMMSCFNSHFWA